VACGSTRVGASKRRFEAQESNTKVIAAHGSPIPFLRRGSRDELFKATGMKKLPTLKLADGTIISHSRAILAWVGEQQERGDTLKRAA
jgi:glutathione S-transferase